MNRWARVTAPRAARPPPHTHTALALCSELDGGAVHQRRAFKQAVGRFGHKRGINAILDTRDVESPWDAPGGGPSPGLPVCVREGRGMRAAVTDTPRRVPARA